MDDYGIVTKDDDPTTITSFNHKYSGDMFIESTIYTTISSESCKNCLLKSIDLSKTSITSIGTSAFYYCPNLEKVVFPDSLTTVSINAFYHTLISEINIPSLVVTISRHSFNGCEHLNKITVSENNAHFLSENNFVFNKNRTKLIMAPSNARFNTLPNLNSIQSIGELAFSGSKLDKFIGTQNLSSVDSYPFHSSSYLVICDLSLTKIKTITNLAFHCCYKLKYLYLPQSLNRIVNGFAYYCNQLQTIIIPANVSIIDSNAFDYSSFRTIIYLGETNFSYSSFLDSIKKSLINVKVGMRYPYEYFGSYKVTRDAEAYIFKLRNKKLICSIKVCSNSIRFMFFFIFISRR